MDRKRVSIKIIRPNPLFEEWLMEWRDEARGKGSKMEKCYSNALSSLKKYPLPLSSGRHCLILRGFGGKICKMLDDKLELYKRNDGVEFNAQYSSIEGMFTHTNYSTKKFVQGANSKEVFVNNSVGLPICTDNRENSAEELIPHVNSGDNEKMLLPPNDNREKLCLQSSPVLYSKYSPTFRSGGYAILMSLYQDSLNLNSKGYLTKEDILSKAQLYCDKLQATGYYTMWSSMSNLIAKEMVTKEGNPARYCLTDQGIILAHKFYKNRAITEQQCDQLELSNESNNSKVNSSDRNNPVQLREVMSNERVAKGKNTFKRKPSSSNLCTESREESFIMQPGTFDILLLVDTQETSGASRKHDDPIIRELEKARLKYEVRHLKIGDYLWTVRDRESGRELVLPYVVERKRIDDFGSSIKDGRFHEQKFRLKQSGLPKLIYLVENYNTRHTGLPLGTLYQAATNTLIQDGFMVKFTEQLKGTIEYLTNVTRIIVHMYKDKTLISCARKDFRETDLFTLMSFNEFNLAASKSKTLKVQEMFVKQLLQLKGVSVDKALSIIQTYPTPKILMGKYSECTQKEGENLLAGLHFGKLRKNIGPAISKTVYQLFNFNNY